MGIVNLTPDSFYDGGTLGSIAQVLNHVEQLLNQGATFVDLGAVSSKPNAKNVGIEEEKRRLLPVVEKVREKFPEALLSIDTFESSVARACLEMGAVLINDITAGTLDTEMLSVVAEYEAVYVMMHMQGTPQTMQLQPKYDNIVTDLLHYFSKRIALAHEAGIHDVIVDPGFGFGKTLEHNYALLHHLDEFRRLHCPLMMGVSRKSMIYKPLQSNAQEALNGTTAVHAWGLQKGVQLLRVHDVKEAKECIDLWQLMR